MKMEKGITYKITIALCLVALLISLTACGGTKTFNLKDITKVELQSGTTGDYIEITEQDQIQNLIQAFNENEFKKGESSKNHTGWSYRLRFYQADKMTTEIVVLSSGRIDFNNSFYDTIEGAIDTEYIKGLLSDNTP
jgi:hypothetical protein